jgi:large subunit ribosomal protein L4
MAAPKAPVLDASGKKAKDVTLAEAVFAAEVKPHLVHEAVRAEAAAARAGTKAAKSRGLVSGGRSKPWRQKGTGRARAGTTRAPQWTGGGMAFAPQPRSFDLKVNRKAHRAAFRAALSDHARRGTLAVVAGGIFEEPSTRGAAALLAAWGAGAPLLVVAQPDEEVLVKSFRNLTEALVVEPSELEVGAIVWARSVLATEGALERVSEVMSK